MILLIIIQNSNALLSFKKRPNPEKCEAISKVPLRRPPSCEQKSQQQMMSKNNNNKTI